MSITAYYFKQSHEGGFLRKLTKFFLSMFYQKFWCYHQMAKCTTRTTQDKICLFPFVMRRIKKKKKKSYLLYKYEIIKLFIISKNQIYPQVVILCFYLLSWTVFEASKLGVQHQLSWQCALPEVNHLLGYPSWS